MTPFSDAHIHLDQYPKDQLEQLIGEWIEQGVESVLAVSTNLRSSYQTLELKQRYPDFIYAAVGYHPEQALPPVMEWEELLALVQQERNKISAIGEVGLPHYFSPVSMEPYEELLEECTRVAVLHHLPIVLHAVHDKAETALQIMKKHSVKQAQFHWLKAPEAVVTDILQSGYYISVTPEICYRTRDQRLTERVPLSRLLLETDGPWPFEGSFKNRSTSPLFIKEVAEQAASLKGVSRDDLVKNCNGNLKRLLNPTAP